MKVVPSTVEGVALHSPNSAGFETALASILGRAPRELLRPAIPFSIIVENQSSRKIALLGVRFDMLGPKAKPYSVVHYSDTLRNPEKGDFGPGAQRFICAEPEYTSLVIRGDVAPQTRGRMNLDNLRRMLRIRASLDCVAFEDGQFAGPDTQQAFERFAHERVIETELLNTILAMNEAPLAAIEECLCKAVQDPEERGRRTVARKLLEGLEAGGPEEMRNRAETWRCRIPLWREPPAAPLQLDIHEG
jgi:hypothetical protein